MSAAIKSYADSYYNINADVNYISWSMQGCLRLYDSPKYIYLFDKAWPDSAAAAWLCLIASDSPDPTYYDKSIFRCYSGTLGGRIDASDGRVGDNSWDGCGVTNQSATLLASFYYDPAAESGAPRGAEAEGHDRLRPGEGQAVRPGALRPGSDPGGSAHRGRPGLHGSDLRAAVKDWRPDDWPPYENAPLRFMHA